MNKKFIIIFSCFLVLVICFSNISFGTGEGTQKQYLKVGLSSPLISDKQVNLLSEDGFSIKAYTGEFKDILNFEDDSISVKLDYYFEENEIENEPETNTETGLYHIMIVNDYYSYDEILEKINEFKNNDIPAFPFYDGSFKICIGNFLDQNTAEEYSKTLQNVMQDEISILQDNKKRIIIENDLGQVLLMYDKDANIYLGTFNKDIESSLVQVEEKKYRGYFTFNRIEDELIVINYVYLEQYLYGVVPREMSASWPLEALKAQAVAARNYGLMNIGRHYEKGYDLCDSTHCQVYRGYDWENIRSNQAVDETVNKVVKYNGKLISTYYHSSSGGKTDNSENVWKYEVPYLRAVDDEFSLGSPNDNWQLVLSKEELLEKLKVRDIDVGEVLSVEPLSYSESGRVLELAIKGTKGTHILEKDYCRVVLGGNSLKSNIFDVKSDGEVYVLRAGSKNANKMTLSEASFVTADGIESANRGTVDREKTVVKVTNGESEKIVSLIPNVYVFEGKGWGHGLGMSQWGAKKMAEEGYSYVEILEFYYTGVKVE